MLLQNRLSKITKLKKLKEGLVKRMEKGVGQKMVSYRVVSIK